MDFGSKQCWLKPSLKAISKPKTERSSEIVASSLSSEQSQQQLNQRQLISHEDNLDTNIVTIGFDNLKEKESQLQMGDPIFCKGCKAVLSQISKLEENKLKKDNSEKIDEEEESKNNNEKSQQKNDEQIEAEQNSNLIWTCEFCETKNYLSIEVEEIPQQQEVIYMVQNVNVSKLQDNNQNLEEEQTIVFAIDVSGSMSVTAPIKNKETNTFKHSTMVSNEDFEMLKQFMDEEDIHQYTLMQQQQNFISRKQCVLAAIQQQLEDLSNTNPNKKVGFITFNNEVTIYGSGSSEPIVITGDKLYRAEEIYEIAQKCSKDLFNLPVNQAKNRIVEIFNGIKEKDQTALGPALVAALGVLSKQKKGSTLIACTDGLANVGVGSFEEKDQNNFIDFYEDVKNKATESDVVFSIISIKGEGCKLDILGGIADKTGGNVIRVDPDNLHKDFANILQDEVVALKAEMTIFLKNIMKFRNTDPDVDKVYDNGSKCIKFIGNATKKSIASFEYTNKTDEEMIQQKIQECSDKIKEIPFQAQIVYYNLQGHKMLRVVTKSQEITFDKQVAEKNLNYNIINQRIATHTAQLMQNNNFQQARQFNKGWEQYVQNNQEVDHERRTHFKTCNQLLKNNARNYQKKKVATSKPIGGSLQGASQSRSQTSMNFVPPQQNIQADQNPFAPQQQKQCQLLSNNNNNNNQPVLMSQTFSNEESNQKFGGDINYLQDQPIQFCLSNQSMAQKDQQLFNTAHFRKEESLQLCKNQQEKEKEEQDDDVFSVDENYDEEQEEDDFEAFMYQQKNNKF